MLYILISDTVYKVWIQTPNLFRRMRSPIPTTVTDNRQLKVVGFLSKETTCRLQELNSDVRLSHFLSPRYTCKPRSVLQYSDLYSCIRIRVYTSIPGSVLTYLDEYSSILGSLLPYSDQYFHTRIGTLIVLRPVLSILGSLQSSIFKSVLTFPVRYCIPLQIIIPPCRPLFYPTYISPDPLFYPTYPTRPATLPVSGFHGFTSNPQSVW